MSGPTTKNPLPGIGSNGSAAAGGAMVTAAAATSTANEALRNRIEFIPQRMPGCRICQRLTQCGIKEGTELQKCIDPAYLAIRRMRSG